MFFCHRTSIKIPKQHPATKKLKDKHPGLQIAWKPAPGCSKRFALLKPTLLYTAQKRWAWVLLSSGPGTPNGTARQRCNYPGRGHLLPEGNISDHLEIMVSMLCRHHNVRDFKQAPELKARASACGHTFLDKMWVPTLRTGSSIT